VKERVDRSRLGFQGVNRANISLGGRKKLGRGGKAPVEERYVLFLSPPTAHCLISFSRYLLLMRLHDTLFSCTLFPLHQKHSKQV
jgi:hypothetical protein